MIAKVNVNELDLIYACELYKKVSVSKKAVLLLHIVESRQFDDEQIEILKNEIITMSYCLSSLIE